MFYYNSNPELISTITFHNECELRQDKQPGYDGYQTTEHPNVFEPENVLQTSGVDNSMFLSLPIHSWISVQSFYLASLKAMLLMLP